MHLSNVVRSHLEWTQTVTSQHCVNTLNYHSEQLITNTKVNRIYIAPCVDWFTTVYKIDIVSYSLTVFIFNTSILLSCKVCIPSGGGYHTPPATKKNFSHGILRHKSRRVLYQRLNVSRGCRGCKMFLVGIMILCSLGSSSTVCFLLVFALGFDVKAISVALSLVLVWFDVACSVCVIPYGTALFSIVGLLTSGSHSVFEASLPLCQFLELE